MRTRRIEKPENSRAARRRLVGFLLRQWPALIPAAAGIIVSAVSRAAAPAALGGSIEAHLERSPDAAAFVTAMAWVLGLYLAGWASDVVSGAFMARAGNRLVYDLRRRAFAHVQMLSMSYFDRVGIGDLISRLTNDIEMIYNALTNGFSSLIGGLFSVVGIVIAMLSLDPPLTLAVLIALPFMVFATAWVGRRVRSAYRANQHQVGRLSEAVEESIGAAPLIQSFGNEAAAMESFRQVNRDARVAASRAETIGFALHPVMRVVNGLALAMVVGTGGVLAVSGVPGYSVGLITAFVLYARRVFEPLRHLTEVYNLLQSALAGSERVFEVLDTEPDIEASPGVDHYGGESGWVPTGAVDFSAVSFSYRPATARVLEDLDLSVGAGETVAVVGPTGAGKTTLVNLLSRFYDVSSGSIRVDGVDVRDLPIHELRRHMGVVLQEPYFFADTIGANIAYGRPGAGRQDVMQAARTARADEFIRHLPLGYETMLAERGENLSQGERQLLAIARAVLARPSILILDEATSSVDSLTERRIQEGLLALMKGRTSLIIAHRLSTIRNADRVVVLLGGRIVEQGSHDELVNSGGAYSRLYRSQFTDDFDRIGAPAEPDRPPR